MPIYKDLVQKVSISPEKKTKQKDYLMRGSVAVVDQGQQLIGGYINDDSMVVSCELPVVIFGDHTRVVKYIPFPFGAGADGIKILQPKQGILPKFLYYATQYLVLKLEDKGYARHYQYLEKKELDVPSIPDQKRIVARIEELFSQLDSGVEMLKKIRQQLTIYRQAALKEAFKTVRTEDYYPLKMAIIGTPQNGLYKPKAAYGSGTRILRIDGFYDGFISESYEFKRVLLDADEVRRYKLHTHDLIVNRVNSMPYLGKCALVRKLEEITVFESNMMRIQLNQSMVYPEYVAYFLSSHIGRRELTKNAKQAVNQASINQTDVGNAMIPIPKSIEYQKQIVVEIESRLSVCDSIEKTVNAVLQQTESMRQSILKHAFEGELI